MDENILNETDRQRLEEIEKSAPKLESIVEHIVTLCCKKVPVRIAALFLYNKHRDQLVLTQRCVATYHKRPKDDSLYGHRAHRSYVGIVGRVFGNRQILRTDCPIDNILYDDAIDKRDDQVPQSLICLPLIANRQKIGVLQLVDKLELQQVRKFQFDHDDEEDALSPQGVVRIHVASDLESSLAGTLETVSIPFTAQDEEALGALAIVFANLIRRVQTRLMPAKKNDQAILSTTESNRILNMFTLPTERRVVEDDAPTTRDAATDDRMRSDSSKIDDEVQPKLDALLEKIKVAKAVTVVQAMLRGKSCRRRRVLLMMKAKLVQRRLLRMSATIIQRGYRKYVERREAPKRRKAANLLVRVWCKYVHETEAEVKSKNIRRTWYSVVAGAMALNADVQRIQRIATAETTKKLSRLQAAHRAKKTRRVIHKVFREHGLEFRKPWVPAIATVSGHGCSEPPVHPHPAFVGGTQNAYRVFRKHEITHLKVNQYFDAIRSGSTRRCHSKQDSLSSSSPSCSLFGLEARRLIGEKSKQRQQQHRRRINTSLQPTQPIRTVSYTMALKMKSPAMQRRTIVGQGRRQKNQGGDTDFEIGVDRVRRGRQAIQLALQLLETC